MRKKCKCGPGRNEVRTRSVLPLFSGILIALIPKCPFCILAYSSAMTLCSGSKIYQHTPNWTSYISIGLAVLTLFFVLLNYRGWRTIVAAGLIVGGSCFIVVSETFTGMPSHFYIGAVFLMSGVWVNANFMYFYRLLVQRLRVKVSAGNLHSGVDMPGMDKRLN